MSGYIRREDRLFDPTTGALVGYIDANGNEQLGSPVSGDWIDPAVTFANLPVAAGNAGKVYRVSDVGPVGAGSYWICDGSAWSPMNGEVLYCAAEGTLAAPLATVGGAAGKFALPAGDRVVGGSILLPIGLPQVSQGLRLEALFRHRGTGGTWLAAARLGSLDTSSDSTAFSQNGSATNNNDGWMAGRLYPATSTTFISTTFLTPSQNTDTAQTLRNANFNTAAQLYLGFYASTLNAADFLDLISYRVYLLS